MSIDDLTYGELKEISKMFAHHPQPAYPKPVHPMHGKFCIARCYAAGVHAGTVIDVDGENVILKNSIRLWSWKAVDGIALSAVAQNGVDRASSKLDVKNPEIYLTGVCELIPCTNKAMVSIYGS